MSSPPSSGEGATDAPSHAYRLVSATYQNKEYPEGILKVNDSASEMELRQWTGKRKKVEAVVARFLLEPDTEVLVDGPLVKVSGLSLTMESPKAAGDLAYFLKSPARDLEAARLLAEAETTLGAFLETREEAMDLLSRVKVDSRGALLAAEPILIAGGSDPLDAVYSTYSARLSESLEKMKSSFAEGEKTWGSRPTDRLYAIACTVGAVQDALFEGNPDLSQELAALQELGISTTAEELRTNEPTARLIPRAHPALLALATSRSV